MTAPDSLSLSSGGYEVVDAGVPEPAHRRVLHAEFAAGSLPDGFEWAERYGGRPAPDAA